MKEQTHLVKYPTAPNPSLLPFSLSLGEVSILTGSPSSLAPRNLAVREEESGSGGSSPEVEFFRG